MKTTKDQLIKHYFKAEAAFSLCRTTDSIYLVGFRHRLILWDEQRDQEVREITDERVFSIKRVLTTDHYIIKTWKQGVKVVIIKGLKEMTVSIQHFLEAKEYEFNFNDSLQL